MKLSAEQSQKLLANYGMWITEACNECGKLLGSVGWTRRGEPGEWCSPDCRDGVELASIRKPVRFGFKRSGGRPRKYKNDAQKMRQYRQRLKNGLALRNTASQLIENSELADARTRSLAVGLIPAAESPETPPIAKSLFEPRGV